MSELSCMPQTVCACVCARVCVLWNTRYVESIKFLFQAVELLSSMDEPDILAVTAAIVRHPLPRIISGKCSPLLPEDRRLAHQF